MPDRTAPELSTRQKILVTSLLLFNENGEQHTTTNEIADELDISPGNLHYHFRRKSDLVAALVAEFEHDTRDLLAPPADGVPNIEDLWFFMHMLLEVTTAYRFLFRDPESLGSSHAEAGKAIRNFVGKLGQVLVWYLEHSEGVELRQSSATAISRNLVLIVLFSEHFDEITGVRAEPADAAARTAEAAFQALLPVLNGDARRAIELLSRRYK